MEDSFESQEQAAEFADHLASELPDDLEEGRAGTAVYEEMTDWLREEGIAENFTADEVESLAAQIADELGEVHPQPFS